MNTRTTMPLITATREHAVHTEFEKHAYTSFSTFGKCVKLATVYGKAFEYECTIPMTVESSPCPGWREVFLFEPYIVLGRNDRGDVLLSVRLVPVPEEDEMDGGSLNKRSRAGPTCAKLEVVNLHEDGKKQPPGGRSVESCPFVLSESHVTADSAEGPSVFIQESGIPVVALQYAKVRLRVETQSSLPINAVCTFRVLPRDARFYAVHSTHAIRTVRNADATGAGFATSILYAHSGMISAKDSGCLIM